MSTANYSVLSKIQYNTITKIIFQKTEESKERDRLIRKKRETEENTM
jgi:hypothetical protein